MQMTRLQINIDSDYVQEQSKRFNVSEFKTSIGRFKYSPSDITV
jgi:hypothetical protein